MSVREKVRNFKTKHRMGFTKSEIEEILKDYPGINISKFNEALTGVTCMTIDEEMVIYHSDIEIAITCGLENRSLSNEEWD